MNVHNLDLKSLTIAEYASALAKEDTFVMPGPSGTVWIGGELGARMLLPTFHCAKPAPAEIRQVLWEGRAAIVSFVTDPDKKNPPNAWLHVCLY